VEAVEVVFLFLAWLVGLAVVYVVWQHLSIRQQSHDRVFEAPGSSSDDLTEDDSALVRWLFRAGLRKPGAAPAFIALTLLGICLGLAGTTAILLSDLVRDGARALERLPGGVGELFIPLLYIAPWMLLFALSSLPWLYVRAVRRRRVARFEEDLPLTLDLLATLAEAGLGFDAGLDRVLGALTPGRPLAQELGAFQAEVLGGRGRVAALRRLSRRVDVLPFTVFISALVQTEQTGAGVVDVLRRQAEDMRNRRREQATAFAMALPVKLLFPLVICFLPGLFAVTLGPTFYQFFQAADAVLKTGRGTP
jgi:tight adherence protein C